MILRQISLGVHSYAVVHFPCLTKKSFKNRDFGSFRRYCDKYHSEYIRTPSFIFLVLRKNPSKIESLGLFGDTATNFARSTFRTPSLIFLVLRKNSSKIEILGLFGDTATNVTRSTFVRCRSFSLSCEKILQKSRVWDFSVILRQISLGVPTVRRHSFSDRATKCVTRFTFKTNFKLCHSSG